MEASNEKFYSSEYPECRRISSGLLVPMEIFLKTHKCKSWYKLCPSPLHSPKLPCDLEPCITSHYLCDQTTDNSSHTVQWMNSIEIRVLSGERRERVCAPLLFLFPGASRSIVHVNFNSSLMKMQTATPGMEPRIHQTNLVPAPTTGVPYYPRINVENNTFLTSTRQTVLIASIHSN